jgi:hypothetical protein
MIGSSASGVAGWAWGNGAIARLIDITDRAVAIFTELHVTMNTVEKHLSHAWRAVSRRARAPLAVLGLGPRSLKDCGFPPFRLRREGP